MKNNINEDVISLENEEKRDAMSYQEIFDELKKETENFTLEEGFSVYLYDTELAYAEKILRKYYNVVSLEDELIGEVTVYIVTFSDVK